MAKLRQEGMLGSIKGSVGNVVRTNWKGKELLRAKGVRRNNKKSVTQIRNQSKFGLASSFIYSMGRVLDITFRHHAVGKTPRNAALSNLIHTATGSVTF